MKNDKKTTMTDIGMVEHSWGLFPSLIDSKCLIIPSSKYYNFLTIPELEKIFKFYWKFYGIYK